MTSFVQKILSDDDEFAMTKNAQKDVVDLIGLLPTNHILILQWHTGVYEETFDVNIKIAQTTQNSWNFTVRKSSLLKTWQTSAIIWKNSYSNLDTGRYGPKSGVSRIIRKSRQHAWWENCLSFFEGNVPRSPGLDGTRILWPDYLCLELKT